MDILNYIAPFITLLFGFWAKGQYEKRKASADTDLHEVDTHKELYEKMQQEFVKLHNQLMDYQKKVMAMTQRELILEQKIDSLETKVENLSREVKAANDRAELYRKALKK